MKGVLSLITMSDFTCVITFEFVQILYHMRGWVILTEQRFQKKHIIIDLRSHVTE